MAPKPILYGMNFSPPVRGVLLTAKALGLDLDFRFVDMVNKEHLKPEFVEMNPEHTVPTLDDDGFILWDSHAIITYLADKYGKNDSLYPKDLQKRALIEQRLHFDTGCLFSKLKAISAPLFHLGQKEISEAAIAGAMEAYGTLEIFLKKYQWAAGDEMTIADLSLVSTVSSIAGLVPPSEKDHKHVIDWIKKLEKLPYYAEANQEGLDAAKAYLDSKLAA